MPPHPPSFCAHTIMCTHYHVHTLSYTLRYKYIPISQTNTILLPPGLLQLTIHICGCDTHTSHACTHHVPHLPISCSVRGRSGSKDKAVHRSGMYSRLAMLCVQYMDVHHFPPSFYPSFCFVLLPSLVSSSCSPLLCVVL